MKRIPFIFIGIGLILVTSLWVIGQTCSGDSSANEGLDKFMPQICKPESVPLRTRDTGAATSAKDRGTLLDSEEMMNEFGFSKEKIHQMKVVSQTPVFMDSPAALYGQADELKLTTMQKAQLMAIIQKSRKDALAILSPEQKTILGPVPDMATSMLDICREIQLKMKEMKRTKNPGRRLTCPMCPMMQKQLDETTTKPAED